MAKTGPAQAGDTTLPAEPSAEAPVELPEDPVATDDPPAEPVEQPTREQTLAATEAAAYQVAGHDRAAINDQTPGE